MDSSYEVRNINGTSSHLGVGAVCIVSCPALDAILVVSPIYGLYLYATAVSYEAASASPAVS